MHTLVRSSVRRIVWRGGTSTTVSIVDRLQPGTVSVHAAASQPLSSLEQLLGRGLPPPKPHQLLRKTDLLSSVVGSLLPPHKAPDGTAVPVDQAEWGVIHESP